jgi:signal transduction histidine kinase/HAMP domain-containing protein
MTLIIGLFTEVPFFLSPSDWIGWLGLLLCLGVIAALLWRWRGYNKPWKQNQWIIFISLLVLTPLTSLLFGLRLPAWNVLPPPGLTLEPIGPALMIFTAVPWVLAAGLLGPAPAAGIAAFSGLLLAYWDTHSPFTPCEYALLAILFAVFISQRYRTRIYVLLRSPVLASIVISLFYPLIFVPDLVFVTQGPLEARIDYAILHIVSTLVAVGGAMIVAGLIAEFVKLVQPRYWGGQPPWIPSPAESHLESRLIFNMTPLAVALILTLMIGDWIAAGNAAQTMLQERMSSASELSAQTVPFFLDTGQNLVLQFAADERLVDQTATPDELQEALEQLIRSTPYFTQLFLLNVAGGSLTGYPLEEYDEVFAPIEEKAGIDLALNGVLIQVYTVPPAEEDISAQISFIAAIGEENNTQRVLIGRTDLSSNPFSKPILAGINSMEDVNGEGYLLDSDGRILYHPDPNRLMLVYPRPEVEEASSYEDTAPNGTRQMVYYQPALGRPWSIVMTVPARSAQQLAVQIASPLLIMIIIIALFAIFIMRLGLRKVTSSLDTLAVQADRIAQGELDRSLPVSGNDEVAQLSRAFEKMRVRLKGRLHDLNQLLEVSQGVASSLEMQEAVQPILKSALTTGGIAARIVLVPAIMPDFNVGDSQPARFSAGPDADRYAYLDEQILVLMQNQDDVVVSNTKVSSPLKIPPGLLSPEAFITVALRHENLYYGVLWLAYNNVHNFASEERRFIITLAQQAALAASNAHLFMTAEIGRQRLAAILASNPDPVLVTDHGDRLLLLNPAALSLFRMQPQHGVGKPVADVLDQAELIELMRVSMPDDESVEVTLNNGRIYLATASSIMAEGNPMGRVCVLRDVTHFKELDALKSEFVATVSHDLRSPLTLMRGYATMLEMVGDLNNQQEGYVQKIVVGVESMSRLVNNLLDLGRIEAKIGLRLEMLSVHDIVENVVESLSMQAAQKHIDVKTSIPEEAAPLVEADQALLTQALHNLVENAIKYTPSGGEVAVSTQVEQGQMVFEVQDTGIGVSPIDQPRLFEKFYRSANREAKRERGTGLGLAIVKSIAERHGGRVGVQSKLGGGSTFFFTIPIKQAK